MDYYEEFGRIFSEFDESSLNYLMEFGLAIVGIVMIVLLIALVIGIVRYVLQSAGLYSIATRRGIHNPWLAWIPVAQYWIMGCVSDQYQYVVKGKIRNTRKVLIALAITQIVLSGILGGLSSGAVHAMSQDAYSFRVGFLPQLSVNLISMGVSVALIVFRCIALYDLYSSCCPENNVLFLVLGIIFPITVPFFIFCNRKKDHGMPPRVQPVYQQPTYHQEDSWVNQ